MMHDEDELLPISALQHLLFCERRAALVHIEGLWDENRFTVEGHHLHERSDESATETRGDVRVARGLLLRSLRLGLTGKADVVEFHSFGELDKTKGTFPGDSGMRWRPVPVEYKRGRLRHEEGYEIQLCAQALCLEEMTRAEVPLGAVYYGQTRRRLEVVFTTDLRTRTEAAAVRLHELVASNVTPAARFGPKCERCSMFNVCLPKATRDRRSAGKYLARAIAEIEANTG